MRPDVIHDVCSAIHPFAAGSPYLSTLPLADHGLEWFRHDSALAHPMTPDRVGLLHRDLDRTAEGLGPDGPVYRRTMGALIERWPLIESTVLGPLARVPNHPLAMAAFGLRAIRSTTATAASLEALWKPRPPPRAGWN